MTNPSEVVADLRIAAEDARRFSAALFDRGYVRREGVRPFSELLERAADTIDRLTSTGGEQRALIKQIVAGTAPMSKWMGSVDYYDLDGFQSYLESQLSEKLHLKASLDPERKDNAESESLATFVDGAIGIIESALVTFRTVRERMDASPREGHVEVPVEPTEAMLEAAERFEDEKEPNGWGNAVPITYAETWKVMLEAYLANQGETKP